LKFIVDDQWRCSDDYPTATDNDGHLVNYIEVPNVSGSSSGWDPSSEPSSPQPSRQQTPFGGDIPPHLAHSALLEEQYLSQRMPNPPPIPHPAALPRHLEKVILNAQRHGRDRAVMEGVRDDNSVLPIPNHVVLNHLGTSAIKNGVLAVATTMRYHKKVCRSNTHDTGLVLNCRVTSTSPPSILNQYPHKFSRISILNVSSNALSVFPVL
jgi:5'-AMP-activated protein kinase, regulatory beta subunit